MKIKSLVLSTLLLCGSAFAQEHSEKSGEFYVVTKALMTTSSHVDEGEGVSVDGEVGGGIGLDIGYTLPYHLALELDTSYSKNSVTEKEIVHGELEEIDASASYWTYAFDVVYTLPVWHHFALMGKLGYEVEHEEIKELHMDKEDNGVVYGAGVEYHIASHYDALFEYEQSSIDSPRGSSLYAGLKYIF